MKKTQEMNRPELIYELARHAAPIWYHCIIDWPTYQLRELLAYYRDEAEEFPRNLPRIYRTKGLGDTKPPQRDPINDLMCSIFGADVALDGGQTYTHTFTPSIPSKDEMMRNISKLIHDRKIIFHRTPKSLIEEMRRYAPKPTIVSGDRSKPRPGATRKLFWPVWAIWNDHTIDMRGASVLEAPSLWIRKGRTINLINFHPHTDPLMIKFRGNVTLEGNLNIKRAVTI